MQQESEVAKEHINVQLWHVHQYLSENIRFADTKAALVSAWAGGVVAWLLSRLSEPFVAQDLGTASVVMCSGAIVVLCVSFGVSIVVIAPVLSSNIERRGIVVWDDICSYGEDGYAARALSNTGEAANGYVAAHNYQLAEICSLKFARVRLAVYCAAVGTVIAGLCVAI